MLVHFTLETLLTFYFTNFTNSLVLRTSPQFRYYT